MKKSQPTMTDLILAAAPPADAGDMQIAAEAVITAEAAVDGKPPVRNFGMTAYNGGEITLAGWRHPVVVDLAGLDTRQSHRPILIDHVNDFDHLIGQTDSITKTATSISVTGRIHAKSPLAKQVVELHDDGFKFQASIGARPVNNEFVPSGGTATANGRLFHGPINIVRKSVLNEVSFVRLGADDSTSARIAANAANTKESDMPFEQWLNAKGFTLADLSDAQKATLTAMYDAETAAIAAAANPKPGAAGDPPDGDPAPDPVKTLRAGYAAETKRIAAISTIHGEFGNKQPDIAAKAVEENWSPDQFKIKMYESAPRIAAGTRNGHAAGGSDIMGAVLLAAACLSGGISSTVVEAGVPSAQREQVMNEAHSSRYRGIGLHGLMDATIAAAGETFTGSRKSNDYIRAAFQADAMIRASGSGFSTMSFSGILGNVANKQLIDSYQAIETVWQFIAGVRSFSDFKPVNRFRLDMTGSFKKVGPDGELKHVGMVDSGFVLQPDTYGAMIALTRQMQINDDLGAFLQIPQGLGTMAAQRLEEAVMVLLLANSPTFFSSGNANLKTGGGSAFGIDAITAGETAFRNQVGPNKKPILTSPKIVLVPTTLKVQADAIYKQSVLFPAGTAPTSVALTAENPHAGKYQPYTSPYLNNTAIKDQDGKAIPNQSDTAWYMLADPKVRAAIVVGFLNGQQTPTIESAQTDFNTLGMQWRAFEDFGVGFEDPTAAIKNAGA